MAVIKGINGVVSMSIKKLAFILVVIAILTNIILLLFYNHHGDYDDANNDVDVISVSTSAIDDNGIDNKRTSDTVITSPSDLFRTIKQKQHKRPIRNHIMTMEHQQQKPQQKQKQTIPQQKQKQRRKSTKTSSSSTTYTCSYGSSSSSNIYSENNRTKVTIPIKTPTFILIGVQKSGTTALLTHFSNHPAMLQTKRKFRREAHFFDTAWHTKVIKEFSKLGLKQANDKHCFALEQYMKLFEIETILANSETLDHTHTHITNTTTTNHGESNQLYTFEKTPSYFSSNPEIPKRIKQIVPWSKTILILRNPIDRLYSQYKMTIKDVYNLRKYSLEDMIYHELKAMGKTQFNMTSLSENQLPIPINGTHDSNAILSSVGGEQDLDAGIPIIASDYKMPSLRNFQNHPIPPNYWIPNKQQNNAAINKYSDKGPLGHQILIRKGLYSIQLKWWLKHYTVDDDLLIINYDDLLKDTYDVYLRILDFVDIPHPPNKPQNSSNSSNTINYDMNNHKVREDQRKSDRPLKNETRRYLSEFYKPYNIELEKLLGPKWSLDKLNW